MSNNKLKKEKIYWLFFSLVKDLGPRKIIYLDKFFGSLKNAFASSFSKLKKSKIEEKTINNIIEAKNKINLKQKLEYLKKSKIKYVYLKEKSYPRLLKEIYTPPPVLFYKGNLKQDEYNLAIVGTRKTSSYGRQVTAEIAGHLASQGLTIVSGLALGIDTLAHKAALDHNGRTIAVLGSGLNKVHPRSNIRLAEKIIESRGLIISEFSPLTPPLKQNFPRRNRIISGLSLGTLVIEAPKKSGALITARYALEQNREVFAVPGSIYSQNSVGTNNIIKQGAKVVTQSDDLLEALNLKEVKKYRENKKSLPKSPEEEKIMGILKTESLHVDKIIQHSKLEPSVVNSTLSLMEMKGLVKNIGGMIYTKAR
ncbi:MAG: DNA-processing protein DprA [Patescibacteria group bacterium]|nr:DNA-processing protein DprA [Patescibacteria group bacterium]